MNWKKIIKIIGITIGVYAAFKYTLPIVIPFLFGWLLAYWIHPLVLVVQKKTRLKRGLIGGILLVILIAIMGALVWWLGSILLGQVRSLIENFYVVKGMVLHFTEGCCETIENMVGISRATSREFIMGYYEKVSGEVSVGLPGQLLRITLFSVKQLVIIFSAVVIIFIAGVLFVKDIELIQDTMKKQSSLRKIFALCGRIGYAGGAYFKAQLTIMIIVAAVCSLGLFIIGNRYFLLVGLGIGFLDALPMIGTGTILVPWGIICMIQGDYFRGICFIGIYIIADLIRQFMEPKLLGDSLGVYPVLVLFSVYAGLFVYGILGFVLGPLTIILVKEIYAASEGNTEEDK